MDHTVSRSEKRLNMLCISVGSTECTQKQRDLWEQGLAFPTHPYIPARPNPSVPPRPSVAKNARHEDESAFTACFTKVLDSGPCQLQPLPQKTCHSEVTADTMLATRTYWASCLRSLNNRRKQHQTETILHHLQHPDRSRRALCPKCLGPP